MDTSAVWRALIERILTEYATVPYAYGDVKTVPVFDSQGGHYLLMNVGQEGRRTAHGCLAHLAITDDKIWIWRDGTEHGFARDLVDAGVSPQQIVLAFHAPEDRPFTGFATG